METFMDQEIENNQRPIRHKKSFSDFKVSINPELDKDYNMF